MVTTTEDLEPENLDEPALEADPGEERSDTPALSAELRKLDSIKSSKEHDSKMKKAFAFLAKEPKVRIRVRKELGPQTAIINGARFNIPAGIPVDVPESVAGLLQDAEII